MKIRSFIFTAVLTAIICVSAFLRIPTPVAPLTFTAEIIILACLVCEDKKTPLISVCMYLFMGLLGLPVFSSGGGISAFLSPTAGFLLGYVPCAVVGAFFRDKGEFVSGALSVAILYICGVSVFFLISKLYLGGLPASLFGSLAAFLLMLLKDLILLYPVVIISRRIKKAVA